MCLPKVPLGPQQLRAQVLSLYKTLLYYGRDYPLGYAHFRDRCHRAFIKNKDEKDAYLITKHLSKGDFVIKELEALYRMRKYRFLKQRYYPDNDPNKVTDPMNKLKQIEKQNKPE